MRERVLELIRYLGITENQFATNCGLTKSLLHKNIKGDTEFSGSSLLKIMQRYPVSREWLIDGVGKMWNEDYFKDRFLRMAIGADTDQDRMQILPEVFEVSPGSFARRVGISRTALHRIANGQSHFNAEKIQKIRELYPYIPLKWFG